MRSTAAGLHKGMNIHIGTSGWHYRHWVERFYPRGLDGDDWLAFYAREFDCVEINNSFYRLPAMETIDHWLARTPREFVFTLKASRYITHMKKLHDCGEPLAALLPLARRFGDRLAAVLFQLPPRWHVNQARLAEFLAILPPDLRYAIEFRDPSWHVESVYALLRDHGVGFCQYDLGGQSSPPVTTSDLVYLRLHGPRQAYAGSYAEEEIRAWARQLRAWDAQGDDVYVFFDNDQDACAVQDARALREQVTG